MKDHDVNNDVSRLQRDRQMIHHAQRRGTLATLGTYTKLSGPGWLQSALTLGGGSLGSSLYLGILAGFSMIWLQPFAMILGVIMLSAISYVTLSTGERPFRAINRHINPVLGWSWLAATLIANMVWSLPQYSLCYAVLEQNFLPSLFQDNGLLASGNTGKWTVSLLILAVCTVVTWSYGSGNVGVKIYEALLKVVVALIVLCFVSVVVKMSLVGDGIHWGAVLAGLIPDVRHFYQPVATFRPLLDAISDPAARSYWSDLIVSEQRDVMISAGAAAVGINMTFFMPYVLLSRGWDKDFRGLTVFDLSTGMFIPFVVSTCCIVIAAAQQFHTELPDGFVVTNEMVEAPEHFEQSYDTMLEGRQQAAQSERYTIQGELSTAERQLAAVLVRRDTFDLAKSLEKLFADKEGKGGHLFSNIVFGIGVVGMTLSSISIMMLISGFVVCEVCNVPPTGWIFRLGCLASASGVLWPLVWAGGARAWLTIVAGVFGAMLLPIAYITFYMMMNQKSLLGDEAPQGWRKACWNTLMAIAAVAASAAGISAILKRAGYVGLGLAAAYIALVLLVQVMRPAAPVVQNE